MTRAGVTVTAPVVITGSRGVTGWVTKAGVIVWTRVMTGSNGVTRWVTNAGVTPTEPVVMAGSRGVTG